MFALFCIEDGFMIEIGLTTWAGHPSLSENGKEKSTLTEYAANFPLVEGDNSFYATPTLSQVVNWQHMVPEEFKFIFKANQLMTLHDNPDESEPYLSTERRMIFTDFNKAIYPLVRDNQLEAILFQFPPSFRCTLVNIQYLMEIRRIMARVPIAVEFRNVSWFTDEVKKDTLAYLKRLDFINVIVDEPFDGNQGMPMISEVTNSKLAILRLHGHNLDGWLRLAEGSSQERTNYDYSEEELQRIAEIVRELDKNAEKVDVIFNNNGGKAAADNAKRLQEILHLHFNGLGPMQMDLF